MSEQEEALDLAQYLRARIRDGAISLEDRYTYNEAVERIYALERTAAHLQAQRLEANAGAGEQGCVAEDLQAQSEVSE